MYEQTSMIGPHTAEAPAPAARYYEINEETVSYTHLDVYKRQLLHNINVTRKTCESC